MNKQPGNRRVEPKSAPVAALCAVGAAVCLLLLTTLFPNLTGNGVKVGADAAYETFVRHGYYFNTFIETVVYAKDGQDGETVLDAVQTVFSRVHGITNRYGGNGDIYRINNAGAGEMPVKVGAETFALLKAAIRYCERSGGAFDIGIGAVSDLWGFGPSADDPDGQPAGAGPEPDFSPGPERKPPDGEDIAAALEAGGYKKIILHEEDLTVEIPPGMKIDLGAIAKGYAVREAAGVIRAMEIESAVINAGGNVQVVGKKPNAGAGSAGIWNIFGADSARPWNIGIKRPEYVTGNKGSGAEADLLAVVSVTDKAVVTSGDYERYFEYGGVRYCHIFDPETGKPARACAGVTVVADDSALADFLSTALFVLGPEKGLELAGAYPGVEALILASDMKIYTTPGFIGKIN